MMYVEVLYGFVTVIITMLDCVSISLKCINLYLSFWFDCLCYM